MFGMRFAACPVGPDIKPNMPICTMAEALQLANYSDEEQQIASQYAERDNDRQNARRLPNRPVLLPFRVYSALFPLFGFIQGKDGQLYVPAVMQDRTVQMVDSGMRFAVDEIELKNSLPEAASKKIVGSIWSGDRLLAQIEIKTDPQGMLVGLAQLVWTRTCCTKEIIAHLDSNSHLIHSGRLKIHSNLFSIVEFDNKSLIAEDPLGVLSVSDAGCRYIFPTSHIMADTLFRFTLVCQKALKDRVGGSFGVMDIPVLEQIRRTISSQLDWNKPSIPFIACFDTLPLNPTQPQENQ